jgi:hypothetical protein
MGWSPAVTSGNVVAIHAALVPTDNGDGEIILFGGDNHDYHAAHDNQFDHSARFNCRHPAQALIPVRSPPFDLFCCGHAFLADGRLMVAGGTAEFPADAGGIHHALHFDGHRHSAAYHPASGTFSNLADMGSQPGHGASGGGRWYPTLCTLGTGEVYAFQGHPLGTDSRHGNNTPELYQPGTNSWISLPAIGNVAGDPILYPRLHLVSDGRVFVTSRINGHGKNILIDPATSAVQEVSPLPDGDYHNFTCPSVLLPLVPEDGYRARFVLCGGPRSQFLDLGNAGAGWQTVPRRGATANLGRGQACATLLPTGDVLLTGGTLPNTNDLQIWLMDGHKVAGRVPVLREDGTPEAAILPWRIIAVGDFGGPGTVDILWRNEATNALQIWLMDGHKVAGRVPVLREDGTPEAAILPWRIIAVGDFGGPGTADVLWSKDSTNDQTGVMQPEIYRTPLDRRTRTYSGGVGHWETINEPATVLRNYHSSALLMPDGRVWTAGGNSAGQPGSPPMEAQKRIEIYAPPYPAGTRPTITSAPSIISHREEVPIHSPQADAIGSIVLMRCGSSTHAFNSDQRAIYLRFSGGGGDQLIATAPPNGNVAPPGPYMLFIVDRAGRPCQYARFVYLRRDGG